MAGKKISDMSRVTPMKGDEYFEIIQKDLSDVYQNRRVSLDKVRDYVLDSITLTEGPQGPQGPQGSAGPQGSQGPQGPQGNDGLSAYQVAQANGFSGTEADWLASLRGPQGAQGPQGPAGEGGGGGGGTAITVTVNSWSGEDYDLPAGVTVEKEFSDTSIRITHGQGKFPTGWFGFNRESSPWTAMVPTSMRNMQIVDANTVIITSVGSFEQFDVSIQFS